MDQRIEGVVLSWLLMRVGNANESTDLRSPDIGISGSVSSISVLNGHSCPIHTN